MQRKVTLIKSRAPNSNLTLSKAFHKVFHDCTLSSSTTTNLPKKLRDKKLKRLLDGLIIDLDSTVSHLTSNPLLFLSQTRALFPRVTIAAFSERFNHNKNPDAEEEEILWMQAAEVDFVSPRNLSEIQKEALAIRFRHSIERRDRQTIGHITFIGGNWYNPKTGLDFKAVNRFLEYGQKRFLIPRTAYETLLCLAENQIFLRGQGVRISPDWTLSPTALQGQVKRIRSCFKENGLPSPIDTTSAGYRFIGLPKPELPSFPRVHAPKTTKS